jgi:hypothetical protein
LISPRSSCGCSEPSRRTLGHRRRRAHSLREPLALSRSRDVEPVKVPGSSCRPFLKVEKDADKFAACNALSDEIGPINTPKKAFRVIGEAIGDEINEVFGVMTLDIHLRMKGLANTGRGESASVMAPIQSTLRTALAGGGDYAIIYHVHPSGVDAEPSQADKDTTKAFVDAFESIGMPLIDHVIVGGDSKKRSYYSFAEEDAL